LARRKREDEGNWKPRNFPDDFVLAAVTRPHGKDDSAVSHPSKGKRLVSTKKPGKLGGNAVHRSATPGEKETARRQAFSLQTLQTAETRERREGEKLGEKKLKTRTSSLAVGADKTTALNESASVEFTKVQLGKRKNNSCEVDNRPSGLFSPVYGF